MDLPREPQFYPEDSLIRQSATEPEINSDIKDTQGCKTQLEVSISFDSKQLDEALKKANRLAELLKEVQQTINSLSGIKKL